MKSRPAESASSSENEPCEAIVAATLEEDRTAVLKASSSFKVESRRNAMLCMTLKSSMRVAPSPQSSNWMQREGMSGVREVLHSERATFGSRLE
eukprot:314908-Prymnesium_polylepis.1